MSQSVIDAYKLYIKGNIYGFSVVNSAFQVDCILPFVDTAPFQLQA